MWPCELYYILHSGVTCCSWALCTAMAAMHCFHRPHIFTSCSSVKFPASCRLMTRLIKSSPRDLWWTGTYAPYS